MPNKTKFCKTCGRWFTPRGFTQHLLHERNQACKDADVASIHGGANGRANAAVWKLKNLLASPKIEGLAHIDPKAANALADNMYELLDKQQQIEEQMGEMEVDSEVEQDDEQMEQMEQDGQSADNGQANGGGMDTTICDAFEEYLEHAEVTFDSFSKEEIAGIKLLDIMFRKRAPLNTYEEIQKWRTEFTPRPKSDDMLSPDDVLSPDDCYGSPVTREHLMKKLYDRYNLKSPFQVKVQLPHSKAVVKVPCHDFGDQLTSLLTDPRIKETDYNFHNDDPFAPPPPLTNDSRISDVNSAEAYVCTHNVLIDGPNQVLVGVIFYMDAAVTGQYDHLPVKALKFSLSCFKKETRLKNFAWRTLGYIAHFVKEDTIGKKMFEKSGHMDICLEVFDSDDDDSTVSEVSDIGLEMDDDVSSCPSLIKKSNSDFSDDEKDDDDELEEDDDDELEEDDDDDEEDDAVDGELEEEDDEEDDAVDGELEEEDDDEAVDDDDEDDSVDDDDEEDDAVDDDDEEDDAVDDDDEEVDDEDDEEDVGGADHEADGADHDVDDDDSSDATAVLAQDFHTQLDVILEHSRFRTIQQSGFHWKLNHNGSIKPMDVMLFVPHIKGDTDEHDRHCGSYTNRSGNVCQLCRYCMCPTHDTDNPLANYGMKTEEAIQALVDAGDEDGLKALSQHYIQNAWYGIRFGLHNQMGVHGACPSELLHAILLGWYKYTRNMFFAQVGKDSALSDLINAIAKQYGSFFRHQSDRDLPRTHFSKGIKKGKLMAKEYTGLILILLTVLRSAQGRYTLMTSRNRKFRKQKRIDDWVMLLEKLLCWECWLRQDSFSVKEVKRSQRKNRYLMALFKKIGNRLEGMAFCFMKFHVVCHLSRDVLWHGPPNVVDTGSNESHHKFSKTAAKMTSKNASTFDLQTAERLVDMLAIELAIWEIEEGDKVWEYYHTPVDDDDIEKEDAGSDGGFIGAGAGVVLGNELEVDAGSDDEDNSAQSPKSDSGESAESPVVVVNGGTWFKLSFEAETGEYEYRAHNSRSKFVDRMKWDPQLVQYIQEQILDKIPEKEYLMGFSAHKRNGIIFRGHPNYRGLGPWFDWAMIDWGGHWGIQPAQIWTFLDLSDLPMGTSIDFGDGTRLDTAGTYAVVESALPNPDLEEVERSVLLVPYLKETISLEGDDVVRNFFLVDVDAIHAPTCMVPDMGGEANAFLRMRPRSSWLEIHSKWLKAKHENIRDLL